MPPRSSAPSQRGFDLERPAKLDHAMAACCASLRSALLLGPQPLRCPGSTGAGLQRLFGRLRVRPLASLSRGSRLPALGESDRAGGTEDNGRCSCMFSPRSVSCTRARRCDRSMARRSFVHFGEQRGEHIGRRSSPGAPRQGPGGEAMKGQTNAINRRDRSSSIRPRIGAACWLRIIGRSPGSVKTGG